MSIYDTLNSQQQEAVFHTEGPVLILAGAGSGKTRVLTHRVAYLIEEKGINPWNIMAITFTNKAAGEMRERVDSLVGFGSESIWVSTFHSTCVRILRRYIERLGFDNNFTIYDSDDQKSLMKDICKRLQIDTKIYKEKSFLAAISKAKDELITPEEFALKAEGDFNQKKYACVYAEYQKQLRSNNALDFDDLIVKTVDLFQTQPDVLEYYQERFKYIMIDEYQDTNTAQFQFVSLLSSKYKNLCVVGDDDQSIYKFRGANIANILSFEKVYPTAKVIKLEQNYRSTQNILDAANQVICNNTERKDKSLWTDNDKGDKIELQVFNSAYEEAEFIVGDISQKVRNGDLEYKDCAILYRTNAQSRMFEEKFVIGNIPYKIVGGVNFYARKEIKDLLAYLKTIDNARDDLAVRRIINVPRRGIGPTTLSRVQDYALDHDLGFYDALKVVDEIPNIGRSAVKIRPFVNFIQMLRSKLEYVSVTELMQEIIEETGYVKELEADNTEEAMQRIENIDELISKIVAYEEESETPTLSGFLEEVALVADIDNLDEDSNHVVLMTLHSAKGLEFPNVYLAGMEDGIFPSYMTIVADDPTEIEEERRLCYVGITRARKWLTITSAKQRMIRGETQYNKVSRFVNEIPRQLFAKEPQKEKVSEVPKNLVYAAAKKNFHSKPFEAKPIAPSKNFGANHSSGLDYSEGDTVRHMKFGEGKVLQIVQGGRDYEVTVAFERVGTKKMFASFAKLKKCNAI
ncbi:DNA helicase PcrA [Anaerosacchariphilus polymeriproducens]|uniref:ATP-dependent DNA helicase n=1 Tax=Anaerosacchariphilus polymeriproducens TaxID=1812858 RepID=A0A371AVZ0_9FIRM|nr:DNA helicase PcrA [Anaerosacchariphilus polymeriproducens]RDU23738.1 DNA helicase PcrA [Anaerosacchariphilus polymeriproducens]